MVYGYMLTPRTDFSTIAPENSARIFRNPSGLGLATATTSAAFRPHLEQRVRSARVHLVVLLDARATLTDVNPHALHALWL
jgi:hypothetical protein